ncbi:MAG: ABC transporter related [uncultured Thermomicrobiales bacterium]|uniref:ABC transporter related n=1 Tax=uncultured Thermomicrobiales bacterium TaxID=1645740 RepID=A0A6J4U4M4_9BACT|nr:MAG: ABC transporter related [uncultured Thermomicrobiales bacterium]
MNGGRLGGENGANAGGGTRSERVGLVGVAKAFGRRGRQGALPVLDDVDLSVAGGEFVAVLGPSGCGKSTLLRLIAGLDRPTAGEVRLGGQPVTGVDARCAIVFQEPRLLPWRSVAANVALGARGRATATKPEALLAQVGLDGFAAAYPHQLSGGMAQRAGLARALIGEPRVLLLDEPFAALDALTRLRMQDLLAGICRQWRPTVVMVTHDVDEALTLADRIVIMGPRPARVVATIAVPTLRPRDRADPALARLRAEILGFFGFGTGTGIAPAATRREDARHDEREAAIA